MKKGNKIQSQALNVAGKTPKGVRAEVKKQIKHSRLKRKGK